MGIQCRVTLLLYLSGAAAVCGPVDAAESPVRRELASSWLDTVSLLLLLEQKLVF